MSDDLIITVASWEERFWLGFKRLINKSRPKKVIMYYFQEYKHKTKKNRNNVKELCKDERVELNEYVISFDDSMSSWKMIYKTITESRVGEMNVIVDISTMPRETIWTILDLLEEEKATICYVYHKPKDYNKEWLSRDPERPRIVYKLGGIVKLGAPTELVIQTGYDLDRIRHLIAFFEPKKSFLGIQIGEEFGNLLLAEKLKKELGSERGMKLFELDSFSEDHGFGAIKKQVMPLFKKSNVIMSSLGHKLSAVALYRLHKLYIETSLVYAPSREFNPEYSHGIGETLSFKLNNISK